MPRTTIIDRYIAGEIVAPEGVRFLTRSRVFSDAEADALAAAE